MSPEQAEGKRLDARSDIFSYGSVLYEMLTGKRAFQDETKLSTLSRVLHGEPSPISEMVQGVPPELEKIVLRCLRKDPDRRFQHMVDLRLALEETQEEWNARNSAVARRPTVVAPAALRPERFRRWALRAGFLVSVVVAVLAVVLYYREREQNKDLRRLAGEVFYQMRTLDAEIVRMRRRGSVLADIRRAIYGKQKLEREYDRYLGILGLYDRKTPTQKAVMSLARRLGETDLDVPPEFYKLAMSYVDKWRSSPRLRPSVDRARQRNLVEKIQRALDQQGLPREFLYLALQESNFDATLVSPRTSLGVAKGLWQLVPETAVQYGLNLGPLSNEPKYDPLDERHNEDRSTEAAVRYLAYLYTTKAAASGLLVIASYSYGQSRVIEKLDELPDDPQERNFWNFYENGWIPEETRDFVMYVFTAALICEQPDLFNVALQRIN
jgi:soluble lytic murein transglycosylase-like protein